MIEFFKKLHKKNFYTDPAEHIIWTHPRRMQEYDDLYEEQLRFDNELWTNFRNTHNIKCQFHDDIKDIDLSHDIVCLWFFRERSDRDAANDIDVAGKIISFTANKLLIAYAKDIKIIKRKRFFPRRPCVQIAISNEVYVNIKKGLGVNE